MMVHLKFFSIYRDRFKKNENDLELPSPLSVREIFCQMIQDMALAERMIRFTRFAINCEYVSPETMIHDGDELAFIPPVNGG